MYYREWVLIVILIEFDIFIDKKVVTCVDYA